MQISGVLRHKGADVLTIAPTESVRTLLDRLRDGGVGALVVSTDGRTVEGIVSERDVVRRLSTDGDGVLDIEVSQIMTADVHTCSPSATVDDLMAVMTEQRIRHVPVLEDGVLVGIVSIGDVVKQRMSELQSERDQLEAYISR
ncbi:CBS domain-containing protein [Quadrisphaera sp. GCM10027208]|uniref:CBS domain-containing protein n=1 Tax=Quadrisphaera sp. GCM10027208 TaxID=3273423 RepID=UPI00361777AF